MRTKPRKKGVERTKAGRIRRTKANRELTRDEIMATAIEARMKHYSLPFDLARESEAATHIGRLFLQKKITKAQYSAWVKFDNLHHQYKIAICAPKTPAAVIVGEPHGKTAPQLTESSISRDKGIIRRYLAAQCVIQSAIHLSVEQTLEALANHFAGKKT